MNRMQRPQVAQKTVTPAHAPQAVAAQKPKFGKPTVREPEVEEKMSKEEFEVTPTKECFVEEEQAVVNYQPHDELPTKEFTIENSVTIKIKDNYYKFLASETKTVPEDVIVDIAAAKQSLADELNTFIDSQITELLDSLKL